MGDELHPNLVWVVIVLQMCDELHPNVVWGIRFRSGHNSQSMWKYNYVGKTIKTCINWVPCFGFWHVLDFFFNFLIFSESKFQAIMFLRMKHDAHFEPSLEYSNMNFLAHLYLLFVELFVEFVNFYYYFIFSSRFVFSIFYFFFHLLTYFFRFDISNLFVACWQT